MEKENVLIKELRKRISDVIPKNPQFDEEFYLYFWLKVGKFDLDKTEGLIRETVNWRKVNDAKKATESDYHPGVSKSFHITFDGITKSGFSVWTAAAGRFRFSETIAKYGKEAVVYYWLQLACKAEKQLIERNREARKKHGDSVGTWELRQKSWLILDMSHMQLSDLLNREVISVMLALVKMCVTHFPSLEGNLMFINSGKIMEILFKFIRPVLSGPQIALVIYGSNRDKWRPVILEYIDQDQIEPLYGGSLE
ncbi:unnamed protein product, partial [Allacma fusca]